MTLALEIKRILEKDNLEHSQLDLKAMPKEEAVVFLTALNQFDKLLLKFDPSWLKLQKNDLRRWGFIYLLLHNLFHSEMNNNNELNDLAKLEIFTTAQIFPEVENVLGKDDQQNLALAYFVLGLGSLKINHSLPYLISEKVILGEFVAVGGLDNGIWGVRVKKEILPEVALNILEKTKKDGHRLLIKKYKNFVFDFL